MFFPISADVDGRLCADIQHIPMLDLTRSSTANKHDGPKVLDLIESFLYLAQRDGSFRKV